ncbi:MAG TPA: hypothetical protein VGE29_08750 [Prosthecobacter sp.]
MSFTASIHPFLTGLLQGGTEHLASLLRPGESRFSLKSLALIIVCGCAAYGFAIGLWRSPLQGVYVSIKMPCLIFLTLLVNGLVNGMLGQLLGAGLTFPQTYKACLTSFALFSLIVGSLSPLGMAMALDAPPPGTPGAETWYRGVLLTHTAIIAFAGIVANHKLLRMLQLFSGSTGAGWRTLLAWLAGNLFVGAQLSYNLRPFFGNPRLPVQFLRPDPFDGSFYESVWKLSLASLPDGRQVTLLGLLLLPLVALSLMALAVRFLVRKVRTANPTPPPSLP